jgi:hypothetical protein
MEMKSALLVLSFVLSCHVALAGEVIPPRRVKFTTKPSATSSGGKTKISFAVSGRTDVEVSILDAAGKVVRHLAAGVLGAEKAPPAPLTKGLSQSLSWDGKDDFGKAASGGGFKLRVRAGLGVKFARFLGGDPNRFGRISSIATDSVGNLYVKACLSGGIASGGGQLRVFNSRGEYLRNLMPFPSDLAPAKTKGVATWDSAKKCFRPINRNSQLPAIYPWSGGAKVVGVSKQGAITLLHGNRIYRMDGDGGNVRGPFPMWNKAAGMKNPKWNVPQLAVSPDGRYIYYSNVAGTKYNPKKLSDTDPKWPQGRVYRQDTSKPGEDPKKFYDLKLPDWNAKKYWLPTAWNKRTAAYGIAVDAKGHLHICDLVNGGIEEVSPAGKKIGFTPVPWPEKVHIDSKTGNYYVLARTNNIPHSSGRVAWKLLKVVGRGPGAKIAAEMPLKGSLGAASALGTRDGKAVIWLSGSGAVVCVRDAGAKFEFIDTAFKPDPNSAPGFSRISANYENDMVYISNGSNLLYQYDGTSGKSGQLKRNGKPLLGVDLDVGYDGLLYIRTGKGYSGPFERFTPNLKPAPFASGSNVLSGMIYSRMGVGFCEKGLGVGPRGESYISFMYDWNRYFIAGFDAKGKAIKGPYLEGKICVDKKTGKRKKGYPPELASAVIGPIPAASGGVRVDLQGNIYLGLRLVPRDYKPPVGFAKDRAYTTWTGSIVKFPPAGGTVLGSVKGDDPAAPTGKKIPVSRRMTVVNAAAIYPGSAPYSGGGYGGGGCCCVCRAPRFDVDRHGRVIFPNCVSNSVTVLDNAGNKVIEFGAYGNFDSQYVNPHTQAGKSGKPTLASPAVPLAWPVGTAATERSIYVCDFYNYRVVRLDKTWTAETTNSIK